MTVCGTKEARPNSRRNEREHPDPHMEEMV
jgi:hypothetical protein